MLDRLKREPTPLDEEKKKKRIEELDQDLRLSFQGRMKVEPILTRSLVSFQSDKKKPFQRWFKFKEAFSSSLVGFLLSSEGLERGHLLDPFAGSGTSLFAARLAGLDATGVEVLPIGRRLIHARKALEQGWEQKQKRAVQKALQERAWEKVQGALPWPEIKITKGAYPAETKRALEAFLSFLREQGDPVLESFFELALLSVLEEVSYTRKDGQYLRWDHRAERTQGGTRFEKGPIPTFQEAIVGKIREMLEDLGEGSEQLDFFSSLRTRGEVALREGSCLEVLPTLDTESFDVIITSPPYCNRYDYTRTYALELAMLGVAEADLLALRQAMLSCTVENRPKEMLASKPNWEQPLRVAETHPLLQETLAYLEWKKEKKDLNNAGIPRMIRGYFYEMACLISELRRVAKPGAPLFMVNDNVRFAGIGISVDLILSDFAEKMGFVVEKILVSPHEKGNSSQQMGEHGREALRKCLYVWRKP